MSILSTVPKGAAVEGINPNLLRNWYFVGGGTGRGVFPVNSRGQTSYSNTSNNEYVIDGWRTQKNYQVSGEAGKIILTSNYLRIQKTLSTTWHGIQQLFSGLTDAEHFCCSVLCRTSENASFTMSIVATDGTTLIQSVKEPHTSWEVNATVWNKGSSGKTPASFSIALGTSIAANEYIDIIGIKVELGDTQTLCYNDNGTWRITSPLSYGDELSRCLVSEINSDTYAQQRVGNITVQCNSVGSSSLRYYNNLIQSTHKVLDSTFSNPAAQTSDITVTTYDGYLDFSNGFASGATTNITLVLGTSGPVLSTSTTAPS